MVERLMEKSICLLLNRRELNLYAEWFNVSRDEGGDGITCVNSFGT
jgi:hypothetical protein